MSDVLDYREALPATSDGRFDVVMDCNGSLEGHVLDRVLKRGGTAIDITYGKAKLVRSVFLRRQSLASGTVDQKSLAALRDLAERGMLVPDIGAEVDIDDAIPLITRLEAGERLDGKAVIRIS